MTCPRSEIVDPTEIGTYHCVTRCVRRAFLCGKDAHSGRSFEHRREWIRSRLSKLTEIFAIEVAAYAVMHNHLHTIIRIRPDIAVSWSAEEVAARWRRLFPIADLDSNPEQYEMELALIVSQPEKVEMYRKRLCCISWLNRCLNENIARRANAEDECTGRFWEGRFKCQRVDDVAGLLACAAYVDLNPIRAGIATTPETSDHTSIQDRIHELQGKRPEQCRNWTSIPLLTISDMTQNSLTLTDYLRLVDETGRLLRTGKHKIPDDVAPIIERLGIKPQRWVEATANLERQFKRVVGPEDFLIAMATKARKVWFQGIGATRELFGKRTSALN